MQYYKNLRANYIFAMRLNDDIDIIQVLEFKIVLENIIQSFLRILKGL